MCAAMEIMSDPASHLHRRLKEEGREAREEKFFLEKPNVLKY